MQSHGKKGTNNKIEVLHVRLTELHATRQNLPLAIRTLRLKETIQNIHQKLTKSDNMIRRRCVVSDINSSIEVIYYLSHSYSI